MNAKYTNHISISFFVIICISCCFLSLYIILPGYSYVLSATGNLLLPWYSSDTTCAWKICIFHLRCVTQIVPYTKSLLKSLELLNTNLTLDSIINNQNVMYWSMRLYLPSEIFYVAASWRFCCISELHDSSNPSLALLLIF